MKAGVVRQGPIGCLLLGWGRGHSSSRRLLASGPSPTSLLSARLGATSRLGTGELWEQTERLTTCKAALCGLQCGPVSVSDPPGRTQAQPGADPPAESRVDGRALLMRVGGALLPSPLPTSLGGAGPSHQGQLTRPPSHLWRSNPVTQ